MFDPFNDPNFKVAQVNSYNTVEDAYTAMYGKPTTTYMDVPFGPRVPVNTWNIGQPAQQQQVVAPAPVAKVEKKRGYNWAALGARMQDVPRVRTGAQMLDIQSMLGAQVPATYSSLKLNKDMGLRNGI